MNTARFASLLVLSSVGFLTPAARADHGHALYRHIDDHAFTAYVEAREIRWLLHDNFAASRDYSALLEDAEQLMSELRRVQLAAFRERELAYIGRVVDKANAVLQHLSRHVNASDFGAIHHGHLHHSGGGYVFEAPQLHGGVHSVEEIRRRVTAIRRSLKELQQDLDGVGPVYGAPVLPNPQELFVP